MRSANRFAVVFLLVALAAPALADYCPAPSPGVDVGAPAIVGQTSVVTAGSAYDVTAAGRDIYAKSDQFHFAFSVQTGDFDLRVRVASLTNTNEWSKAGLMARESMAANSRQVSVFATPAAGYEFQHRATAGTFVTKVDSVAQVSYPNTWVRLRRAGNEFTSYTSPDGANWTSLGATTLALPGTLFLGMATTSHDVAQTVVAQYRDLTAPVAAPDTQAPSVPEGLAAEALSSSQIKLTWSASTDNVGVTAYKIRRDGVQIASTSALAYTDNGRSPSTLYTYTVAAVDAAGNISARSAAASATTPAAPDTAAPATPTGLAASAVSPSQINLSWSAATDNVGVTGYKVLRGGVQVATTASLTYADLGLSPATIYTYTVAAFDAAGNTSAPSTSASANTGALADGGAPSVPTGLSASALSASQIKLTWSASSDDVGVAGYKVMRGGVQIGGTNALSFTDTGLSASTTYTYTIAAHDAAGNTSAQSASVSATTSDASSANTSPVGTNLSTISDWSREWAFVDAFRSSRPWISGAGLDGTFDDGRAIATDANGWVSSLQPGQVARTLMFWGDAVGFYPSGTYTVLYDGQGTIEYLDAATKVSGTPGRDVLQVNSASGGISLHLTATNPADPIRNIRVIMPGGICEGNPFSYAADAAACTGAGAFQSFETHHASIVFHPKFLERLGGYRVLRFMNWGDTNNSTQSAWSGRAKLTDARWSTGKGVPVEVMVDLANRVGADAWFTLPHLATDNYVTEYAKLVKPSLRSDLKAYVEYSNEVWNSMFSQAAYAESRGLALGLSANAFQAQMRFYSKRSVEVFDLWSAAFGAPEQLVRVMASQAANSWISGEVLDYQNARLKSDALAIAPYFGGYLGNPGEKTRVSALTLNQLFAELESTALPEAIDWMKSQAAVAAARGIPLIAYEGGQHLVGHSGVENTSAINALFDNANRDPRMGTLYRSYLDAWKAAGGALFAHYTACDGYSKWGRWGALEHLEQPRAQAPKFDALQSFIEQNPAWW
jgi:chitodextrinase